MQEFITYCNSFSETERVYMICLLVGLGIPLLNLVLGAFGDIGDFAAHLDIDADAHFDSGPDFDYGAWIPLSPICWSVFLIIFGGFGLIFYPRIGTGLGTTLAVIIGYAMMALVNNTIIRPLRRSNPAVLSTLDLIGQKAKVVNGIKKDSIGSIVIVRTGVTLEYSARTTCETELIPNSLVTIEAFDEAVAIVNPVVFIEGE